MILGLFRYIFRLFLVFFWLNQLFRIVKYLLGLPPVLNFRPGNSNHFNQITKIIATKIN